MLIKNKIKILKKNKDFLFTSKMGKVIENGNKCYQVPKWISSVFKFYYYSGIVFFVFLGILYFSSNFSEDFYIRLIIAIVIFFLLESLLFFAIPIKKISCWRAY